MATKTPTFKPSKTVTEIESGRTRDTTYDETVSTAYASKGTVFEAEFPTDKIDDVRKGLQRSALFLNVRVATRYEETDKGTTIVYLSAHDKMARNGSRKVKKDTTETATVENPAVETADA
jgi:hypothetical protein